MVERGNYELLQTLLDEHEESKFRRCERWEEEEEKGTDYCDFLDYYKQNEDTSRLHFPLQFEIDIAMEAAVRKDDLKSVDILIKYAEPDFDIGMYPIHMITLRMGNVNMMRQLMEDKGMTFDEINEGPLEEAVEANDSAMLKFLIEKGLNVNIKRGAKRVTALHVAAARGRMECAKVLIQAGAQINLTDRSGRTALHIAAKKGDLCMVKILVAHSADMSLATKERMKPWMLAASAGHSVVAKYLITDDDINANTGMGNTLLHLSCKRQDVNTIKLLIEMGASINAVNDRNETSIIIAAKHGFNRTLLKTLIKAGADCSVKDVDGHTALLWSLLQHPTTSATFARRAHILDMMVKAGADINLDMPLCPRGTNLIHCHVWDLDKTRWLLKHKARTSDITENGGTLWHQLLSVGIHRVSLCKSIANLLDNNVDISLTEVTHVKLGTPLIFLFGKYKLASSYMAVAMLLDVGCSLAGIYKYLTEERRAKIRKTCPNWERVIDVVIKKCSLPTTLAAASRLRILKQIGPGSIDAKVDRLALPGNLKSYLHWREYISQLPPELKLTPPDQLY